MEKVKSLKEQPKRKQARMLFMVRPLHTKSKDTHFYSDEISKESVFLETFDPLPKGTKVKLRFPLRSSYKPITIEGRVVLSIKKFSKAKHGNRQLGMEIVFEKINKKDLPGLQEILDNIPTYGWFL